MKKVIWLYCVLFTLFLSSCANRASKNSPAINIPDWVETDLSVLDTDIPLRVKLPKEGVISVDSAFGLEVRFSNVYTLTFARPLHDITLSDAMMNAKHNDSLIYRAQFLKDDLNGYVYSYKLNDDSKKSPVAVGFKYFMEQPGTHNSIYLISCDLGLDDILKVKRGSFSMDSTEHIYDAIRSSAHLGKRATVSN